MTQTVKLTDEQHARLAAYAKRTGLPVSEALEKLIPREAATRKRPTAPQKSALEVRRPATDDTLPFSPAERRRLKQSRVEAARGETTDGKSFFAGLLKR